MFSTKSNRNRKFNVEPITQINMTPPRSRRSSEYMRAIASQKRLGRIKRAAKREFILSSGKPILTRSVLERAYPRLSRFTSWHYLAARRALRVLQSLLPETDSVEAAQLYGRDKTQHENAMH